MGYLAIGIAFGLMLQSIGYGVGWALLMSATIYAGSGQGRALALHDEPGRILIGRPP